MTAAASMTITTNANEANDATAHELMLFDTGQLSEIDASELEAFVTNEAASANKTSLVITFHEIHRTDEVDQADSEQIMSTLRYFSLHLAVQDEAGDLQYHLDGTPLLASLLYDNDLPVEVQSATHEPALLAAGGQSPPKTIIEGGVAVLRLRITVLSSLCNKHHFKVKVASLEHPELSVTTAPVKTITKLFRGPRESTSRRMSAAAPNCAPDAALVERNAAPSTPATVSVAGACGAKRALTMLGEDEFSCNMRELTKCASLAVGGFDFGDDCDDAKTESLDDLWEQVAQNGAKLLELQAQQRRLFKELRLLKKADLED